jgi:hypothetical protein
MFSGQIRAGPDHGRAVRFPYDGGDGTGTEAGILTLPDYIYSTYNALMESGWKFDEIDRMDMLGFLRIRAWSAKRECKKKEPRRVFIDEVWPDLK